MLLVCILTGFFFFFFLFFFFFQAEDGIRFAQESRGLGDVYKGQFVACSVPLNLVRRTIVELNERLGKEYPFTSTSFKTDGRRIFMELVGDSGDAALVDVVKRQDVMRKVIAPSLRDGIELGIDDRAERWFPLKGSRAVVFDPQRSFGQPILSESGVPTIAIVEALRAEGGDERRVAKLYDLPLTAVKKALQFENRAAP